MNELRSDLSLQIQSVNIARPEVSFKFELDGVCKFFQAVGNRRYSDLFWCAGLQWSLYAEHFQDAKNISFLGFFLRCEHVDQVKWSCNAAFELILFSKSPPNLVRKTSRKFPGQKSENAEPKWGYPLYLSYGELAEEKNEYIQHDKIVLGIKMKAGPVIRG